MEIIFANRQLRKICESQEEAVKKYGLPLAKSLAGRIELIRNADAIKDLTFGGCHKLTGDRHGQYALNLTRNWRLVFVAVVQNTQSELLEDAAIKVTEIVDYHG